MLKALKRKSVILKLDFLALLLGLAGLYQSAQKAALPAELETRRGQVVLREQAKAANGLLRAGDSLLAVNGIRVNSADDVEFILDGLAIGQRVTLTLKREGHILKQSVLLQPANTPFYLFVLALAGLIFLGLGILVLAKRAEGDEVALVFHWLSLTVALHILTTFGRYTVGPDHLGYLLRFVFFGASALTPVLFVHFSFLFPKRKHARLKFLLPLYGLSLLFFLYLSFLFVRAAQGPSMEVFHRLMPAYNAGRWLFALAFFWAVGNFVHSYLTAAQEAERRKLRWVILGLVVGPLSFVLFWQLPQTFALRPLLPEELMLLIATLTPLTFAISIVRYHLLNIDFIFNRSTVYVLVIGLLLLVYAAVVGAIALVVQLVTVKISLLVSAFAAVVVAVLFEPLRKAVQKFVDRRFFHVRYDYRLAQREFSRQMGQCVDVQALARLLLTRLDELLQPGRTELYLRKEGPRKRWQKTADAGRLTSAESTLLKFLRETARQTLNPLVAEARFVEPGISFVPADEEIFRANGLALTVALRMPNARTVGFLALGPKKSGALYGHEDIDLLKTVAQQSAATIERIRLQNDLILQHAEAQRLNELNRLKSFFVSSVSHDLQTPLTSIRMFAELLRTKRNLSARKRNEYLDIICGESERLSRLIRNLLDFSRMERGAKTYDFKPQDLAEIVRSVLRSMDYLLRQHRFETHVELPDAPLVIHADGDAVIEALENLISNAVKYSSGKKELYLTLRRNGQYAEVAVRDKGIGIAPQEQQRIFETYYRANDPQVQAMGGAGLGLSLVKQIMEAHNGQVNVHSAPGKGSTFTLRFPLAQ